MPLTSLAGRCDVECRRCRLVIGRRSPVQRYCPNCAAILARERSRIIVKRRRHDLDEDIRMWSERRAPELERGRSCVRRFEQQDANLRRAPRSAGPNSAERITFEIEAVAVELHQATTSLGITDVTERPLRVGPKLVRQAIDEMTGILEHAPLDTRWFGSAACSSESTSTAARTRHSRSGRPRPMKVLTGRIQ